MRIVIDTNVLARATPGRNSPAEEVLMFAVQQPHALLVSDFLLDELARVMRYDRIRRIHGLVDNRIDDFVNFVRTGSLYVPVPVANPGAVVPGDPDDDPIVATAVLGGADVICTRDRHLPAAARQSILSATWNQRDVGLGIASDSPATNATLGQVGLLE